VLQGFDEYLARGAEEALGQDCTCGADDEVVQEAFAHEDTCPIWVKVRDEVACAGTCTCGAECVIVEDKPKPKYEFYSLIYGNKLGEV
jgi:hypothetical protein